MQGDSISVCFHLALDDEAIIGLLFGGGIGSS
jgi:hypothetical protein